MHTTVRKMGNSQGVLIPKPLLVACGLESDAEMSVEHDAIAIRKPRVAVRAGWAEAAKALAESGDDALWCGLNSPMPMMRRWNGKARRSLVGGALIPR